MTRGGLNMKWITAALCMCGVNAAFAATATTTFTVSSTISAACSTPSAGNLAFGTYNPLGGSNATATADITITCTNSTPITSVTLSAGGSGSINSRQMSKSGDTAKKLNYNLYTSSANTSIWGDGGSGNVTNNVSGSAGTGSAQTLTIYGTIAASQTSAVPGTYSDTITVTINY